MNDNFYGEDSFSLHQQMSDYIQKLEAEKKELIEFIKNIEDTNLDDLLDIKIPEILNKFKEET